jgi:hypothetical protein
VASAEPRVLARGPLTGTAADAARLAASLSTWLLAVTRLRNRGKPISAGGPSNGADDSFTVQDHSQGPRLRRVGARTADP